MEQTTRELKARSRNPQNRDDTRRRLELLEKLREALLAGDYERGLSVLADWGNESCTEFLYRWRQAHPEAPVTRTDILLCLYRLNIEC